VFDQCAVLRFNYQTRAVFGSGSGAGQSSAQSRSRLVAIASPGAGLVSVAARRSSLEVVAGDSVAVVSAGCSGFVAGVAPAATWLPGGLRGFRAVLVVAGLVASAGCSGVGSGVGAAATVGSAVSSMRAPTDELFFPSSQRARRCSRFRWIVFVFRNQGCAGYRLKDRQNECDKPRRHHLACALRHARIRSSR